MNDVIILLNGREIMATRHSITEKEYHDAGNQDLRLSYRFDIHFFEYHGEEYLIHDGVNYAIYRTYQRKETLELYAVYRSGIQKWQE